MKGNFRRCQNWLKSSSLTALKFAAWIPSTVFTVNELDSETIGFGSCCERNGLGEWRRETKCCFCFIFQTCPNVVIIWQRSWNSLSQFWSGQLEKIFLSFDQFTFNDFMWHMMICNTETSFKTTFSSKVLISKLRNLCLILCKYL